MDGCLFSRMLPSMISSLKSVGEGRRAEVSSCRRALELTAQMIPSITPVRRAAIAPDRRSVSTL